MRTKITKTMCDRCHKVYNKGECDFEVKFYLKDEKYEYDADLLVCADCIKYFKDLLIDKDEKWITKNNSNKI